VAHQILRADGFFSLCLIDLAPKSVDCACGVHIDVVVALSESRRNLQYDLHFVETRATGGALDKRESDSDVRRFGVTSQNRCVYRWFGRM